MAKLWIYDEENDKWQKANGKLVDEGGATERYVVETVPVDEDGTPIPVGSPTDPVNVATNSVTVVPTGTLITLTTAPTALPTTPLTGRKWIQFMNEDLVDIQLCDSAGVVFLTLEPGQKSEKYYAASTVTFYGKVAAGTADTGVRAIEGK